MQRTSFLLPVWAARGAVAGFAFLSASGFAPLALAQEEPPAEEQAPAEETAPADAVEPEGEAAPTDETGAAEAADPAEAGTAAVAPVPTIPVDTAQEKVEGTKLDTIQVTGSRLKRTDYETSQPVLTLTREDIERTGLQDISEILRNITAAGNSSLSQQQARFALTLGETNLDLRNLGAQHTLLLVNGRRWITGLIPTAPSVSDYNTIPTSIIERVEVLKDGASAIYGSDAIGGVVNVITRKDYDGAAFQYNAGFFPEFQDGFAQQASISWGMVQDRTNVYVNASYTDQNLIPNENRDVSARPVTGLRADSIVTERGLFRMVVDGTSALAARYNCPNALAPGLVGDGTTAGDTAQTGINTVPAGVALCDLTLIPGAPGGNLDDYRQIQPAWREGTPGVTVLAEDYYNRFAEGTLKEPNERTAFYTQIGHKLLDHMELGIEALYNMRRSVQLGQNLYLGSGNLGNPGDGHLGYIPATHPFNPFGQDIGRDNSCTDPNNCTDLGPGSGSWAIRRGLGLNNWEFIDNVDTLRLGGVLKGDLDLFGDAVFWEAGYIFNRNKIEEISPLVRWDHAGIALDMAQCNATPDCVFLNPFQGPTSLTQGAVDYIVHDTYQRNNNQMNNAFVNVSGALPQFNWLPLPGPIAAAAGLEFRKDEFESNVDPVVAAGLTFLNQQSDTAGSTEAREGYVEFGVPVLKDVPFAHALDIDLAARHSNYPGIDEVTTGKAGLRWQPLDDLLLRATYSTGFRAPNVGELYLGPAASFDPLTDPCADPEADTTTQTNCTSDGVTTGGANSRIGQPYDLWQGNPNLKAEKSENLTFGLVYSPTWLPDLNFNLDFYDIFIEDYITVGLGQYFLDSCYTQETRNYCFNDDGTRRIHRDGAGGLVYIDTPYFNYSAVETSGIDGEIDYLVPLPEGFGRVKLGLDASYLKQFDITAPQPGAADQITGVVGTVSGQFAGYPRWKAGSVIEWQREQFKASWSTRMAYEMTEVCIDGRLPTLEQLGLCNNPDPDPNSDDDAPENDLPTVFYHHLQLGYALTDYNADLTFGVNNVLDQDPPISRSAISILWYNYDPNHYEAPGRFAYLRTTIKF